MLDALEQLLILQDRDRKITYLHRELASLPPQRDSIRARTEQAKADADATKHRTMELETARKELEDEVATKKQLIERYSLQQYQTKKNEEYRALAHEIELAKKAIQQIEDRELDLMEKIEASQRRTTDAAKAAKASQGECEQQIADLAEREENLRRELAKLQEERQRLAAGIEDDFLARYERLRPNKGDRVLVGIDHGVCGGCHMRLPAQTLITCQAQQEIASCINCGRLLYYTREMTLSPTD